MKRKRMLIVAAVAVLGAATGLTAFALARRATSPQGFTIRLKDYAILPDGTRQERADETIYVSASGDVREVRRESEAGEVTEILRSTSDGAVYRIGQKKLHYIGKWSKGPRASSGGRPDAERGTVAGHEVVWNTNKAAKVRYALAPHLQWMMIYNEAWGDPDEPRFIIEAYAVEYGEPPAELFRKPDLPESRELYNHLQEQRRQPEKD
jgi:hypothetical protein